MSVEPEVDEPIVGQPSRVRPGFPLRYGKVQRPLLAEETLRRDRLLDWLAFRARRRVVCVVAEAGFGKTTLVADFLRRSRRRVFWYRLDEDDTDGLAFMRYLVASCQVVDPQLLRRSSSVLNETAIEPLRQETVLETLLSELETLGEVPSALVLDDFHVVEGSESIVSVVERLLGRIPNNLTVFLISRRSPHLQLAAMRARGELAEIDREELRFDEAETERLFRDIYRHPLESDVLHDLQARTEGWAASLRLVGTAVEGRTPAQVRAFVHSIAGSQGDVYDYLAEEVIGDLEGPLRGFLLRTSLLEEMDASSAAVASGVEPSGAQRLLARAEHLGLASKGAGAVAAWRAHPLVREFLAARLESEIGAEGIRDLHRRLAAAFEPQSWRLAARHWAAAGDADEVRRVLCGAVPAIVGTGDLAVAEALMTRFPDPSNPYYALLRSRKLSSEGRYEEALRVARPVFEMEQSALDANPALAIACAVAKLHFGVNCQDVDTRRSATTVLARCGDQELASIAAAAELMADAAQGGSLDALRDALVKTANLNRSAGHPRHEGISLLNLCVTEWARGAHEAAVSAGEAAIELLSRVSGVGDIAAAQINTARVLAHLGRTADWRDKAQAVLRSIDSSTCGPDVLSALDAADLEAMYGSPTRAAEIIEAIRVQLPTKAEDPCQSLVLRRLRMVQGSPTLRQPHTQTSAVTPSMFLAYGTAAAALEVEVAARDGVSSADLMAQADRVLERAAAQQAWFWWRNIRLTKALVAPSDELNAHVHTLEKEDSGYLSIQAELVARRLADLDRRAFEIVRAEAILRPERWRWALRQLFAYEGARRGDIRRAAELMELVGNAEDISLLRSLAGNKSLTIPDAGRALAKRLAPRAYVHDLGRVTVEIGDRVVAGAEIRKKVLSLLVFLLTRPQMTATREQVMDALWPEMEPQAAANSLNQTAYFLRQLFEPKTDDDSTGGYLNSKADLMWLDPELVQSRSTECLELIATTRRDPSPELVGRLAEKYTGRFAADFTYDEWASAFRDNMHAGYLDRVQRSIEMDTKAGFFDRAIGVAQLALAADPEAEQIELQLLRLYRLTGAHAAAAEQYAHYSAVMREQLGVEPPPLEAI